MGAVYWNKELCRYESITMSGSTSSSPYGSHQFSLDEPINYADRRDWWYELAPIYHAGHAKVYCTPRILVSAFVEWDCELSPVDVAPLTVEADGEGSHCFSPRFTWDIHLLMYGQMDLVPPRDPRLTLISHGKLSHASACEVTL